MAMGLYILQCSHSFSGHKSTSLPVCSKSSFHISITVSSATSITMWLADYKEHSDCPRLSSVFTNATSRRRCQKLSIRRPVSETDWLSNDSPNSLQDTPIQESYTGVDHYTAHVLESLGWKYRFGKASSWFVLFDFQRREYYCGGVVSIRLVS